MKYLQLIPILFISALLFSCDELSDMKELVESSSSAPEELSLEEDFRTATINSEYSIMLPKYLKSTNILNDEASLQYQNIIKDIYVIIVDESKQEFIDTFRFYEMYDDSLNVAENLRDAQINNVTAFVANTELVQEKSFSLRGMNIEVVEITGMIEEGASEVEISYTLAFIEGKEKIYTLYFWCSKSNADKYRDTFEKSISTFRELI